MLALFAARAESVVVIVDLHLVRTRVRGRTLVLASVAGPTGYIFHHILLRSGCLSRHQDKHRTEESNPEQRVWNPLCYHYTSPMWPEKLGVNLALAMGERHVHHTLGWRPADRHCISGAPYSDRGHVKLSLRLELSSLGYDASALPGEL